MRLGIRDVLHRRAGAEHELGHLLFGLPDTYGGQVGRTENAAGEQVPSIPESRIPGGWGQLFEKGYVARQVKRWSRYASARLVGTYSHSSPRWWGVGTGTASIRS